MSADVSEAATAQLLNWCSEKHVMKQTRIRVISDLSNTDTDDTAHMWSRDNGAIPRTHTTHSAESLSGKTAKPTKHYVCIKKFLLNHFNQNLTKHMGGTYSRGREARDLALKYCRLCKIWQGHSCSKKVILLHVKLEHPLSQGDTPLTTWLKSWKIQKLIPILTDSSHCWGHCRPIWASHGVSVQGAPSSYHRASSCRLAVGLDLDYKCERWNKWEWMCATSLYITQYWVNK